MILLGIQNRLNSLSINKFDQVKIKYLYFLLLLIILSLLSFQPWSYQLYHVLCSIKVQKFRIAVNKSEKNAVLFFI